MRNRKSMVTMLLLVALLALSASALASSMITHEGGNSDDGFTASASGNVPTAEETPETKVKTRTIARTTDLYRNTSGKPIGKLPAGVPVEVVSTSGGWTRIVLSGAYFYVQAGAVR